MDLDIQCGLFKFKDQCLVPHVKLSLPRATVVHLNLRAGSTFPIPVCTVQHGHWVNKADNQQD